MMLDPVPRAPRRWLWLQAVLGIVSCLVAVRLLSGRPEVWPALLLWSVTRAGWLGVSRALLVIELRRGRGRLMAGELQALLLVRSRRWGLSMAGLAVCTNLLALLGLWVRAAPDAESYATLLACFVGIGWVRAAAGLWRWR